MSETEKVPVPETAPEVPGLPEGGEKQKKPTKKELRMQARQQQQQKVEEVEECFSELFGFSVLAAPVWERNVFVSLCDLEKHAGEKVRVRARVHNVSGKGKCCFLLLRERYDSIQACLFQSKDIPKSMLKFVQAISTESVVEITGTVQKVETPIKSATIKDYELSVSTCHVVSQSAPCLPFEIDDAARPEAAYEAEGGDQFVRVNPETRLDYRWVDLRVPSNLAIFRLQSAVGTLFREFLLQHEFIEIHTPKLQAGASEGGSDVFKLKYFNADACLAQSPQLYKQMCAACSDFGRVFEVGPVFRAENSNTNRHLCEFTGLDLEMTIQNHYHEAMELIGDLFVFIFDNLKEKYSKEINVVKEQFGFEDLEYPKKTLVVPFAEGIQMLKDAGVESADPYGDLTTENEKKLGALVKEKFHTDFYILDKFPLAARPFYTMPDPIDPKYSNSYDFFIRGQEILSGAQRVHDYNLLCQQIQAKGINLDTLKSYTQSFMHGAYPHAGAGIGLDRVVFLYLGLNNVRKSSLFPRDPKRLTP